MSDPAVPEVLTSPPGTGPAGRRRFGRSEQRRDLLADRLPPVAAGTPLGAQGL
jgi:hypothetical protein